MYYLLKNSQAIIYYQCEPEIIIYNVETRYTSLLPAPISDVYLCFMSNAEKKISVGELKSCCELLSMSENSAELIDSCLSTLTDLKLIEPFKC